MKKFIFILAITMTCAQVGNYVKKCEMPDGEICFIFDKYNKGGISCLKK